MVLSGLAKQTAPQRYVFTGKEYSFKSFADIGFLASRGNSETRRFLPGSFIFEHEGKRKREMLETAGALAVRLNLYEGATQ